MGKSGIPKNVEMNRVSPICSLILMASLIQGTCPEGEWPSCVAAHSQAKILEHIESGVPMDGTNPAGENCIAVAARTGRGIEVLGLLESKGAEVDTRDLRGQTPVMTSLKSGAPLESSIWLLMRTSSEYLDIGGEQDPFLWAIQSEQAAAEVVRFLDSPSLAPDTTDGKGRAYLHHAMTRDDDAVLVSLLQSGANPNIRAPASPFGLLHVGAEAQEVSLAAMEALLRFGASMEDLDSRGNSPLMTAVSAGGLGKALLLLEHGANAVRYNHAGESVFGCAIRSQLSVEELAVLFNRLLISGPGPLPAPDDAGLVLAIAAEIEDGSILLRQLLSGSWSPDTAFDEEPCFFSAIEAVNPESLMVFLEFGCDLRAVGRGDSLRNAWHVFAEADRSPRDEKEPLRRLTVLRILKKEGVDVQAVDFAGETPLGLLLRRRSISLNEVRIMLEAGAEPFRRVEGSTSIAAEGLFTHPPGFGAATRIPVLDLFLAAEDVDFPAHSIWARDMLSEAVKSEDLQSIAWLLHQGVDPRLPGSSGQAAHSLAMELGDARVVWGMEEAMRRSGLPAPVESSSEARGEVFPAYLVDLLGEGEFQPYRESIPLMGGDRLSLFLAPVSTKECPVVIPVLDREGMEGRLFLQEDLVRLKPPNEEQWNAEQTITASTAIVVALCGPASLGNQVPLVIEKRNAASKNIVWPGQDDSDLADALRIHAYERRVTWEGSALASVHLTSLSRSGASGDPLEALSLKPGSTPVLEDPEVAWQALHWPLEVSMDAMLAEAFPRSLVPAPLWGKVDDLSLESGLLWFRIHDRSFRAFSYLGPGGWWTPVFGSPEVLRSLWSREAVREMALLVAPDLTFGPRGRGWEAEWEHGGASIRLKGSHGCKKPFGVRIHRELGMGPAIEYLFERPSDPTE